MNGPALDTLLATHGPVLPVVLPLMAGALLLLLESARSQALQRWVSRVSLLATFALLAVAALLLRQADGGEVQAYLVGNWPAPFGIALALDRLGALMVLLTAAVACTALVYALGGTAARGLHFHALFQFQLMGLNGAFLTADLFNLFVFFEVLLAASYGLLLHGRGAGQRQRLQAAVHYVTFNLAGSSLFLIALGLLYGVTGTLNMADLAHKLPVLPPGDVRLAQVAALLLLTVFAVKAALLPLYFWLPDTYAAASAPVGALFAIMTKVGVYAIARVTTLIFGAEAGGAAGIAQPWLPALALAALALGAAGALAARRLRVLIAYLIVASAGTLLMAVGLGTEGTLAAGLFYLVNSTLVAAAMFLLVDRIALGRGVLADSLEPAPHGARRALLGATYFLLAVALAGVPPLAGFLGAAPLIASLVLQGLLIGLVPTNVFAAAVEAAGDARQGGAAMAVIMVGQNAGMLLGPLIFGALAEAAGWPIAFANLDRSAHLLQLSVKGCQLKWPVWEQYG